MQNLRMHYVFTARTVPKYENGAVKAAEITKNCYIRHIRQVAKLALVVR